MLFYNAVSFFLTQKSPTPRNLTSKNPVNFKHASATFIATLFRTKKANLPIFLIINLKGYEILVVKFIEKFTD
ncbi:hypothetical protein [Campylobacter concisus]|uniref:hypothetical protein n=1 Tax=Campylobacter concisus TaxID=199 RepID=UPI000CD9791B|nr:hypothetical protein [Campylobacter concisus]